MFATAVPTRGNLYAHTEQHFPHFLGSYSEHLNLREENFQGRDGKRRPQSHKQPQSLRFCISVVEGAQQTATQLLKTSWWISEVILSKKSLCSRPFLSENSYIYQGEWCCLTLMPADAKTLRLHPNSGRRPIESLWFTECWVMTQIVRIWMTCSPYGSDLLFIVLKFFGAFFFFN